jgi:hypothetical protein
MLAMRSTQDSTIPPSQSAEFLRKDEVDLYRSPWQYIRSDLVALREMANTGDLKKKEYRACIHETIWNSYIKKLLLLIYIIVRVTRHQGSPFLKCWPIASPRVTYVRCSPRLHLPTPSSSHYEVLLSLSLISEGRTASIII